MRFSFGIWFRDICIVSSEGLNHPSLIGDLVLVDVVKQSLVLQMAWGTIHAIMHYSPDAYNTQGSKAQTTSEARSSRAPAHGTTEKKWSHINDRVTLKELMLAEH